MNEVLEIPCIVNGKKIFTGTTTTQVIPHNHGHVIAKVHLAGKDEMEAACKAAVDAQKSWIDIGLEERCAIFAWLVTVFNSDCDRLFNFSSRDKGVPEVGDRVLLNLSVIGVFEAVPFGCIKPSLLLFAIVE